LQLYGLWIGGWRDLQLESICYQLCWKELQRDKNFNHDIIEIKLNRYVLTGYGYMYIDPGEKERNFY
ncbi:MAG: hypothetical protein DRN00_03585, partial [Thermoplasmata archaeon]